MAGPPQQQSPSWTLKALLTGNDPQVSPSQFPPGSLMPLGLQPQASSVTLTRSPQGRDPGRASSPCCHCWGSPHLLTPSHPTPHPARRPHFSQPKAILGHIPLDPQTNGCDCLQEKGGHPAKSRTWCPRRGGTGDPEKGSLVRTGRPGSWHEGQEPQK